MKTTTKSQFDYSIAMHFEFATPNSEGGRTVTTKVKLVDPTDTVEIYSLLAMAGHWARAKAGRKADVYAPFHFSTEGATRILETWFPKHEGKVSRHIAAIEEVEMNQHDYAI